MGRLLGYRSGWRHRAAGLRATGGRSLFQLSKRAAVVSAIAVVCLLLPGCGDDDDQPASRYSSCIDLGDLEEKRTPKDLKLPDGLYVTVVERSKGFVTVIGVADMTVEEIYAPSETALVDSGFEIINRDFEGFEAELFFAKSNDTAGAVRIRIGPCPDQVTLTYLYDPLESKAGRDALEKARKRWLRRNPTPSPS
jgi:hypothetical protein